MKIVICDDQAVVRHGLELLLKLERDIHIVGLARDGVEAVELVAKTQPDLVLMDLKMPGMNGVEATRRIHLCYPEMRVLILTTYDDDDWLFDAIRAGAAGYLLKDTPRARVVEAVRGTVGRRTYVDPAEAGRLLDKATRHEALPGSIITDKLTAREIDVLRLMGRGMNNADIARRLQLSEGTVRNHVSTILAKLDVEDRTQAAILAIQHGIA